MCCDILPLPCSHNLSGSTHFCPSAWIDALTEPLFYLQLLPLNVFKQSLCRTWVTSRDSPALFLFPLAHAACLTFPLHVHLTSSFIPKPGPLVPSDNLRLYHTSSDSGVGIAPSDWLDFGCMECFVVCLHSTLESARKEGSLRSTDDTHLPFKNLMVIGLIGFKKSGSRWIKARFFTFGIGF